MTETIEIRVATRTSDDDHIERINTLEAQLSSMGGELNKLRRRESELLHEVNTLNGTISQIRKLIAPEIAKPVNLINPIKPKKTIALKKSMSRSHTFQSFISELVERGLITQSSSLRRISEEICTPYTTVHYWNKTNRVPSKIVRQFI